MAIHRHVTFNGKTFIGNVNLGTDIDQDESALATDVLVIMIVRINAGWKLPIGFYFINKPTGEEKANLVKIACSKLSEIGITVVATTCDGPSAHFSMYSYLGATLSSNSIINTRIINEDQEDPVFAYDEVG